MNMNWSKQNVYPALETKMRNNQNIKWTKYNENKWPTKWAAISQKVVTQQPKPN